MNVQVVLYLAAAAVGMYFLSQKLFNVDTKIEDIRRRSFQLSTWASSNGLPILSRLLENISVADHSGAMKSIFEISAILASPDESKAVVDRFLKFQLDKKVSTTEGREEILQYLETRFGVVIPRDAVNAVVSQLEVKK